jgi:AraC-like DNA-binding protein
MPSFMPICVSKSLFYLRRYFQDNEICLERVAEFAGCSPAHLSRQLRKYTGCGFRPLLIRTRIDAAKTLLEAGEVSVKAIAFDVGYRHASAFTRDFARTVGMAPSHWRATRFDPAQFETRYRLQFEERAGGAAR